MKLTNAKSMVKKGLTVGLLAGAVALAAPAKANAEVVIGVGVAPYVGYHGPIYYGPGYYERLRIEELRRHEAWVRAHERFYYGYRRGW